MLLITRVSSVPGVNRSFSVKGDRLTQGRPCQELYHCGCMYGMARQVSMLLAQHLPL